MTFELTADDIHARQEDVFIFDLEWVGNVSDSPATCKIWEIGCIHQKSGDTFRLSIMPDLPGDNFSQDHNGSDAVPPWLIGIAEDENYATLKSGIVMWEAWVRVYSPNPILISHNCFSADLPVLRAECIRVGIALDNWCFMDSSVLPIRTSRDSIRVWGVRHLQRPGHQPEYIHRALEDAEMLSNILRHIDESFNQTVCGTVTDLLSVPLQAISGIGHHTAAELRSNACVHSIYDLYSAVLQQGNPFDEVNICEFLQHNVPQLQQRALCTHLKKRRQMGSQIGYLEPPTIWMDRHAVASYMTVVWFVVS